MTETTTKSVPVACDSCGAGSMTYEQVTDGDSRVSTMRCTCGFEHVERQTRHRSTAIVCAPGGVGQRIPIETWGPA